MDPITRQRLADADALLARGRLEEAERAYRRVLAKRPSVPAAWYNLGYALRRRGRFHEALDAYANALRHGIDRPEEVHLNRAAILSDHLRQDVAAERELLAALSLAPGFPPALLNLGNLREEQGRRDEAIRCYRQLLGPVEGHRTDAEESVRREALARLAHLQPPQSPDDPMLARLRDAAGTGGPLPAETRANLLFSLGRAYDRLADHDRAFHAFSAANRYAISGHPRYDATREEARIEALIEAFADDAEPATEREPQPGPAPLFICGMFRSGSTLAEQILATHPDVVAGGELDHLQRLVAARISPFPARLPELAPADLRAIADDYLNRVRSQFPHAADARMVTDKRPENYQLIGLIKRLFPRARILHTIRNPLDTGLSIFMQHLNPRRFAYAGDLGDIGHYTGQYARLMAHWQRRFPDSIFDLDYDALVRDPESILPSLFRFLELPRNEDCLEFHRLGNTVKTASYWQVRRPLYGDASGRWKHYATHLAPLREALERAGTAVPD